MEEHVKVARAAIKSHRRVHSSNSNLKDPPKASHEKNNERHMQSVEQKGIPRDISKEGDGLPARSASNSPRRISDHDVGAKGSNTNGSGTGRVFKSRTERRRASYPIPTNRDKSLAQNTHPGGLGTKTVSQHSKKLDPPPSGAGAQQKHRDKGNDTTSTEHYRDFHKKLAPTDPSATTSKKLPKKHASRKNSDTGEAHLLKRAPEPAAFNGAPTTTPNNSSIHSNGSKKRRRSSADRPLMSATDNHEMKGSVRNHVKVGVNGNGMERGPDVAGTGVDSPTRRTKKIAVEGNSSLHNTNKNSAIAAAPTDMKNGSTTPQLHALPASARRHAVAETVRKVIESSFPVHDKGSPTSLKTTARHDVLGGNTGGTTSNGSPPFLSGANAAAAGHRDEGANSKRGGLNVLNISGGEKQRNGVGSRSLMSLKTYVNHHFFKSSLHRSMKNRAEFTPYALEYNELSVELFAAWAAHPAVTEGKMHTTEGSKNGEGVLANGNRAADSFPGSSKDYLKKGADSCTTSSDGVLFPVAAPIFRKCQICRRYGHYEIECDSMGEEMAVKLADATKMEANMKELWREQVTNGSGIQTSKRGDQQKPDPTGGDPSQATEPLPSEETESVPLHLSCEVCNSRSADDRMLVCDGCDSLYHIFCLDPPLTIIPEGEWFCPVCATFNDGVPSDVEIEAFGNVVVEQRKEPPRESQKRARDSSELPSSWQISVAIVDRNTALTSSSEARAARGLGKHHLKLRKKETDEQHTIDRFVIHARSSSQSPHFTKQLSDLASVEADKIAIDEADVSVGCVVAWFPARKAAQSSNHHNITPPVDPKVGCVLAVDKNTNQVLLRSLRDWRKLLDDASHRSKTGTTSHLEGCAINAITASATVWLPAQDVHVVARAPHPKLVTKFETEIVPSRVRKERRRSRKLALKQGQQASRARTEFAMID